MSVDAKFSASLFEGKNILVTGGTGSFGHAFIPMCAFLSFIF